MTISSHVKILIALLMTAAVLLPGCTNTTEKDNSSNSGHGEVVLGIDEKYLKEGFISQDLYRIVIVSTKEESANDIKGIENKARKRALASLGKYIISTDRSYDNNVKAQLIDMINVNGNFSKQQIEHNRNDIYYFDINRENIKKYLIKISSPR